MGLGVWGENHAKILSELGVLSAVCDSNSDKSKDFGEKFSVNHHDSVDQLIGSEEFDGAFVGTNVSSREEVITKLLGEKKHVFVGKTNDIRFQSSRSIKTIS